MFVDVVKVQFLATVEDWLFLGGKGPTDQPCCGIPHAV